MKRMTTLIMVGATVLSLAMAANLFAADSGDVRGHRMRGADGFHNRGHMMWEQERFKDMCDMPMFWNKLKLTEEQKTKMRTLREAHMKDMKPLQDKLFSKRGDLRLLWLSATPDKDKIVALQKEIREIKGQMDDKMTAHHVDVVNVLTPEQRDKVESLFRRNKGPHKGGGAMMGPGGKGPMGHGPGMGMGPHSGMMGY